MKKYRLIMSDLDNTLLPIETQERFVEMWFRNMGQKFLEYGLDAHRAMDGMNQGIRAMIFNNGEKGNIDVFYEEVERVSGYTEAQVAPVALDYYTSAFENVFELTLPNPYAPEIARLMRQKSEYAVIATMPVFTIEAVEARMKWVGLMPDMFDLVTTAATSRFSKPNPLYYQEILDRFGVKAEEALMIGNDVREDMQPCEELGIDTFLVTEHIITHDLPYERFRRGTYPKLAEFLTALPE